MNAKDQLKSFLFQYHDNHPSDLVQFDEFIILSFKEESIMNDEDLYTKLYEAVDFSGHKKFTTEKINDFINKYQNGIELLQRYTTKLHSLDSDRSQ